tara:strand:+ start:240 stop:731 length:492 start_codon:yes stop_codon:yes gene_type:complete
MTLLQAYLNSPKARRALSKKPGQAGFSLIELVVVVAVLAVLSAIAIPSFNNISGKARATAAANTLATIAKECAAKIADVGIASATHTVPRLDGYEGTAASGYWKNGVKITAGSVTGCTDTQTIEFRSTDTTQYPTFRYVTGTGQKTCTASGVAAGRGCNSSVW